MVDKRYFLVDALKDGVIFRCDPSSMYSLDPELCEVVYAKHHLFLREQGTGVIVCAGNGATIAAWMRKKYQ